MLQFLLDTDHLTLYQHKHPPLMRQIAAYPTGAVGISPISIEAIALTNNLTVVSRNRSDFGRIPGLQLADWSA